MQSITTSRNSSNILGKDPLIDEINWKLVRKMWKTPFRLSFCSFRVPRISLSSKEPRVLPYPGFPESSGQPGEFYPRRGWEHGGTWEWERGGLGNGHMVDLGINSFWTNQEWNPQEILIFSAVLEDPKLVLSSHIL